MVINIKTLEEAARQYGTVYAWRLPDGVQCWSTNIESVPYGGYPCLVVEPDGTIELTTTSTKP